MSDVSLIDRLLDVIEHDIVPMTAEGVARGNKLFGAAILRKDDRSLVIAETNNETENPLWHGEVHCLKRFYEMPKAERVDTKDAIFLATHEPARCAFRPSPGPASTISTISSRTRIRAMPSPFRTT